jgi:ligand-binding SRPBCC domain-containing protein
MRYEHAFRVRAPLEAVARFHASPSSLAAITPPPVVARVRRAPDTLGEGDEMAFTLWLGPLPVPWVARFEDVGPTGFTDRQVAGPFATWVHRHDFVPVAEDVTEVVDAIELRLARRPAGLAVGLLMAAGLPLLFAFRGWKTRRLLEGR